MIEWPVTFIRHENRLFDSLKKSDLPFNYFQPVRILKKIFAETFIIGSAQVLKQNLIASLPRIKTVKLKHKIVHTNFI